MHYLDPNRPRLGGANSLPLLLGPNARSVLPCLHVSPKGSPEDIRMEISIFLPFKSGGASRREIMLSPDDFLAFWSRWLADPEGVAKAEFGWEPEPVTKTIDLDLDDLLGAL